MANRIQLRGDTAANWAASNPVLNPREVGLVTDGASPQQKVGDGVTHWNDLPFMLRGAVGAMWYTGAGVPAVGTGVDGDFYLQDGTGAVYEKITGAWELVANIKGATGDFAGTTDNMTEGTTNFFLTATRVRGVVLTGLSTASAAVITATDGILAAFGKLQAQISGKEPSIGTPTLDGQVLSSTTAGIRSWVTPATGGVEINDYGTITEASTDAEDYGGLS